MAILVSALPLQPVAAQDVEAGARMAMRWCMACHNVERGRGGVAENPPSFSDIASRPQTTAASLDRYLSASHTRMPDFSLSPQERSALVAYMLSLR